MVRSLALFLLAGLCEIGGGYLVWLWLRSGRGFTFGLAGGLVLFLYGVLPTFQAAHFSRVYAAYGGLFILLSMAWGWLFEHTRPDRYDIAGGFLCLIGAAIIMWWPR